MPAVSNRQVAEQGEKKFNWCCARQFVSGGVIIPTLLLWNTAFGATLVWDPNSESDLAGYRVYSGTGSRDYSSIIDVGNATQYALTNHVAGTAYFFAVTAYSTSGLESDFSEEISYTPGISNTPPVISSIHDTNMTAGGSLSITLQVADAQTSAEALTLSGTSSNPTLVPNENIGFAGSGSNRTVNVTPATNQTGTATISITVNDGQLAATEDFVLTVTPANTAPTISSLTDRTIQEDASTGPISFTVHDAETPDALLISVGASNAALVPNGAITLGGSGTNRTVTVIPAANQYGTATITVNVSDGQLNGSANFVLTVTPVNDAPTISAIADSTINQNSSTDPLPFVVGDIETANSNLMLSGTSSNPTLVPNGNIVFGGSGSNRTVSVMPATNQTGTATISVTVSDGVSSATDSWALTVNANNTNTPPLLSSVRSTTIFSGGSSLPMLFSVSDAETPPESLLVWAVSSNPALIANSNIVFEGTGTNRTLRVTSANEIGSATITLSADDGSGGTRSTNFGVDVIARPVELVYMPFEAEEGGIVAPMRLYTNSSTVYVASTSANQGTLSFQFSVDQPGNYIVWARHLSPNSGQDSFYVSVDGVEAVYHTAPGTWSNDWQWTRVNAPAGATTWDPRVLSLSAGTHSLVFRGREANCALDAIIVCNDLEFMPGVSVNTQPVISRIADTNVTAGDSLTIPVQVADAQTAADALTLSGTSSNPALVPNQNITFGGSGSNRTVSVRPAVNQTGTTTVSISVSDGQMAATENFVLTVNPANTAPTISSLTDRTIQEDASTGPISFTVHDAETPDALLISVGASNAALVPNGAITLGGSGTNRTVTVMPAANQYGTATITVNVSDGQLSGSASFVLTVTAVNDAPTISGIADRTINQNSSTGPLPFVVGDIETASSNLMLSGTSSNPTLVPNGNIVFGGSGSNRTVSVTPAANQSGTASIRIAVSDGASSASNTWTLMVTANNTNTPPLLSTVRSTTVFSGGSSLPLRFSVSDAQTPPEELLVWAVSSNPALIANSNIVFEGSGTNRTLRVTAANEVGNATITLSVDDGSGGTRSTTFGVNVVPRPMDLIYLPFEAEEGGIVAPMRLHTNSSTVYAASTSVNQGTLSFQFSVYQPGNYIVWARHLSPNSGQDSFYVSMDGIETVYHTGLDAWSNDWQWTRVNAPAGASTSDPRVLSLSAGTHTLVFRGREVNCGLDQIIICNDLEFIPQDGVNLAASLYSSESVSTDPESSSSAQLEVVWESIPGSTYKVQGRRGQSDVWKDLSEPFVATDFLSSWIDPDPANTWQEYRVILVE